MLIAQIILVLALAALALAAALATLGKAVCLFQDFVRQCEYHDNWREANAVTKPRR